MNKKYFSLFPFPDSFCTAFHTHLSISKGSWWMINEEWRTYGQYVTVSQCCLFLFILFIMSTSQTAGNTKVSQCQNPPQAAVWIFVSPWNICTYLFAFDVLSTLVYTPSSFCLTAVLYLIYVFTEMSLAWLMVWAMSCSESAGVRWNYCIWQRATTDLFPQMPPPQPTLSTYQQILLCSISECVTVLFQTCHEICRFRVRKRRSSLHISNPLLKFYKQVELISS